MESKLSYLYRRVRYFIYSSWTGYSPDDDSLIHEWWYHAHIAYSTHNISGYITTDVVELYGIPQIAGYKWEVYHFPFEEKDPKTTTLFVGYSDSLTSAKFFVRILTWYYTIKQLFK